MLLMDKNINYCSLSKNNGENSIKSLHPEIKKTLKRPKVSNKDPSLWQVKYIYTAVVW